MSAFGTRVFVRARGWVGFDRPALGQPSADVSGTLQLQAWGFCSPSGRP